MTENPEALSLAVRETAKARRLGEVSRSGLHHRVI